MKADISITINDTAKVTERNRPSLKAHRCITLKRDGIWKSHSLLKHPSQITNHFNWRINHKHHLTLQHMHEHMKLSIFENIIPTSRTTISWSEWNIRSNCSIEDRLTNWLNRIMGVESQTMNTRKIPKFRFFQALKAVQKWYSQEGGRHWNTICQEYKVIEGESSPGMSNYRMSESQCIAIVKIAQKWCYTGEK
jgi:hypothetical protein